MRRIVVRKRIIYCLSALTLLLVGPGLLAGHQLSSRAPEGLLAGSIAGIYGKELPVRWQELILDSAQKEMLLKEMRYYKSLPDTLAFGVIRNDAAANYVFVEDALSKTETFTYAVYLTAEGEIIDVDVLIYRENYGGEIDYPAFRKQFRGKQRPQELVLGRSIQNISGATISVRSMTLATRDLLSLFARLAPDIRRISE